jgi:hypothetical protein
MIAFRHRVLSCVAVLACSLAGASAAVAAPAQAPDVYASIQRQPMIFFVAKGTPDTCGPGCNEWIAAEGAIDPDVIVETFAPQDNGSGWSREIKFSTKGLSQALQDLQRVCSGPNFLDAPAVKFLDLPSVSRGR